MPPSPTPAPLPALCDRCLTPGALGDDPFAQFGALLDFEPVPRRTARADGWTPDVQRTFIAALALTGSVRQAARAAGKAPFGADQLRCVPGNEGFLAAWDEALAIAAEARRIHLADGLRAISAEQRAAAGPWSAAAARGPGRPPRAPTAPADPLFDDPSLSEEDQAEMERAARGLLEVLLSQYMVKLEAERRARTAGCIAEADFYLRQITCLEVALDVTSGDGMAQLKAARLGRHDLLVVAATPMSQLLDEARRIHWAECGDPPRPHPPGHLFHEGDGGAMIEPLEATYGGLPQTHDEQQAAFAAQHEQDARAQVEWEAQARRDYERRRASGADRNGEPR